jgi:hypothetical protein
VVVSQDVVAAVAVAGEDMLLQLQELAMLLLRQRHLRLQPTALLEYEHPRS